MEIRGSVERQSFSNANSNQLIGRGKVSIKKSEESTTAKSADAVSTEKKTKAQGAQPTPSGVSELLGRAEEAVSAIASLREEQQGIAAKAATLAEGKETKNLNSRFQDLQQEITRISQTATYQGQNALRAGTYGSRGDGSGQVVSVADPSSLFSDPGVSVDNPNDAQTAYDTITELVVNTNDFSQKISQAQDVSEQVPSTQIIKPEDPQKSDLSLADAQALARKVAEEISRTLSPEGARASSIDSLIQSIEPDRAAGLLSE